MVNGLIFEERNNTSKNWGTMLREVFPGDGVLTGCGVSGTGFAVTIEAGYFIAAGRVCQIDGVEILDVTPGIQTGFMRLKYRIDLKKEASSLEFAQGEWQMEYASSPDGFIELVQEDINGTGTVYEAEFAVFAIVGGSIANVTRAMGTAVVDAEKLGGQLPAYYATKAAVDRAQSTAEARANLNVPDGADANTILSQPARCATHGPTSDVWFVIPMTYGMVTVQLAIPNYTADDETKTAGAYYRTGVNGAWRPWKRLLAAGAEVDATKLGGYTPDHYATLDLPMGTAHSDDVRIQPRLCEAGMPTGNWYVLPMTYGAHTSQLAIPYWDMDTNTGTSGLYYRVMKGDTRYAWKHVPADGGEARPSAIGDLFPIASGTNKCIGYSNNRWNSIFLASAPDVSCDSAEKELVANVDFGREEAGQAPAPRMLAGRPAGGEAQEQADTIAIDELRGLLEGLTIRAYRRYKNEAPQGQAGEEPQTQRVLSDKKELGIFIDDLKSHPLFEYIGRAYTDENGDTTYSLDMMSYATLALIAAKDAENRAKALEKKAEKLDSLLALLQSKGMLTQEEIENL
ncbi:MAG: pyocin knob domain-containing protein [Christensenellaceae bacterium]|jgi:hypothetical protein